MPPFADQGPANPSVETLSPEIGGVYSQESPMDGMPGKKKEYESDQKCQWRVNF
jgi:hypothetical protein